MNNQNLMMSRNNNGLVDANAEKQRLEEEKRLQEMQFMNSFNNVSNSANGLMVRREDVENMHEMQEKTISQEITQEESEAPEREFGDVASVSDVINTDTIDKSKSVTKEALSKITQDTHNIAQQQINAQKKMTSAVKTQTETNTNTTSNTTTTSNTDNNANNANNNTNNSTQTSTNEHQIKIKTNISPDDLAKMYIEMFKKHFDLNLSASICYENMRKICEINTKEADKTLYFIENTYRLSTLLYLTGNLPIVVIATILAEKNRKNVLNYITKEVENAAKPYEEVRDLRMKRYMRKYEDMKVNDAITVTPGVTMMTPELTDAIKARFDNISTKMKKFNKALMNSLNKLDDAAKNDVVYIYSNCWYFLQGFENVPEMRAYIMSITDDTRKNLKI